MEDDPHGADPATGRHEPFTEEAFTPEPPAQEPLTQEPTAQEPTAQEPTTDEPLTQEPIDVRDRTAPTTADLPDVALGAATVAAAGAARAGITAARFGLRVGLGTARGCYRTARAAAAWTPPPVARQVDRHVGRRLETWVDDAAARGRLARQQAVITAAVALALALDRAVPWVLDQALDRIDLTALVAERVDLDALVASVDLDGAVARVDLDAAVARVDIDAAVARADLDAAVARVDVDRVVEMVDLAVIVALAREVIDEIDLPLLIRESSGSVAADLVTDVRLQTLDADQRIARFLDRLLGRGGGTPLPGGSSPGQVAP